MERLKLSPTVISSNIGSFLRKLIKFYLPDEQQNSATKKEVEVLLLQDELTPPALTNTDKYLPLFRVLQVSDSYQIASDFNY